MKTSYTHPGERRLTGIKSDTGDLAHWALALPFLTQALDSNLQSLF